QELELIDRCDLSILLSQEELYIIRELRSEASLAVLPVVFKQIPGASKSYEQRRDILFIGSFAHQPNVDAVLYFAKTIFPIIRREIIDIRFKVVGANPPKSIRHLANIPGIDLIGFVDDLVPLFADIRLSIAPLRYGAGIKGKIGTSLCYGVPCVATPIAAEGMGLTTGKNIVIAETPEQFARDLCEAYLDGELWQRLSTGGHQFALENYSIEVITHQVRTLLFAVNEGWQPIRNRVEIDSYDAFQKHSEKMAQEYQKRVLQEQALLPVEHSEAFKTKGFCCVCGTHTHFLTSFLYSTHNTPDGRPMPNWREHMQCEHCGLVNRVRAILNLLHTCAPPEPDNHIYITERITTTYNWLAARYRHLQGSEYFGPSHHPGTFIDGIRHEDVMNLSFPDNAFDRVLSLDVLEHIPEPERAFRELYRILKPEGVLLFSVPFEADSRTDVIRASLSEEGTILHHLPAEYHGNPVDPERGALCFRYFGWEMLEQLKALGFKKVRCHAYWSQQQGYLGREQYLFFAQKL
ncbi:MAG: glycosyltransferase, partial [Enterobacteriaceae bacterium]